MLSKELELALRMATKAIKDLTVLRQEIQTAALQGPAGVDGNHGRDGANGKDGKDGVAGLNGRDGTNGTDGKYGSKGDQGPRGKDGVDGTTPEHEVNKAGDSVRFKNPDGSWGKWIETTKSSGGGGGGGDSGARPIHTYKESKQLNDLNYTVLGDAVDNVITFTLPRAGSLVGRIITVKKVDNSSNYVIIEGYQSETIDGATSQTIQFQWTSLRLQSTGSEWVIM